MCFEWRWRLESGLASFGRAIVEILQFAQEVEGVAAVAALPALEELRERDIVVDALLFLVEARRELLRGRTTVNLI